MRRVGAGRAGPEGECAGYGKIRHQGEHLLHIIRGWNGGSASSLEAPRALRRWTSRLLLASVKLDRKCLSEPEKAADLGGLGLWPANYVVKGLRKVCIGGCLVMGKDSGALG